MPVRFYCPKCNKPLEIDDADAGGPIMCFYCQEKITAPKNTDPALVNPGESVPELAPEKSRTLGVVSLVLAGLLVLGVIILAGWFITNIFMPVMNDPGFIQMTEEQQREFLQQKVLEGQSFTQAKIGNLILLILAIAGFITSLIAVIQNAGRKFAVFALIITALYLIPRVMSLISAKP